MHGLSILISFMKTPCRWRLQTTGLRESVGEGSRRWRERGRLGALSG